MPHKGLPIISVFDDNMVYGTLENTVDTIEYKDIKSMDFAWVQFDNIIRVFRHDNSVIMLDNGSLTGHGLGQSYQSWLSANGMTGFGEHNYG